MQTMTMSLDERAKLCSHPLTKRLLQLMQEKESNLCHNPDVTSSEELLNQVDRVGSEVVMIKTHIDLLEDFTPEVSQQLKQLAKKHRFLLFEDRKFSDIGHVAGLQYEKGVYHIADWADIVNAHPIPGPGVITGLKEVGLPKGRGLLLVAEMSSKGQLADEQYTKKTIELAKQHPDFVMGFICQRRLTDDPNFLHLTPGVKRQVAGDGLGQQYNTPEKVIAERGSDILIVGRGILQAEDPAAEARWYRKEGWNALKRREK